LKLNNHPKPNLMKTNIVLNVFVKYFACLILFTGTRQNAKAQDGTVDLSFNPTDIGFGYGDGANSTVSALALQPDGKILIGGVFNAYNGITKNRITRLNADGSLDATFAGTGANNQVKTIALQPDGKILIGGMFTSYNGTPKSHITRLNADGSLDATFTGTGANNAVNTIVLQPDGKILMGGDFIIYSGTTTYRVARLNADGSLDATFMSTGADNTINTLALQTDGKILMGGNFTIYNSTPNINRITRLNADGTIDATFNPAGTGANGNVNTICPQPDGKILMGGAFTNYDGAAKNRVARLDADGTIDATFYTGAGAANNTINTLVLQPDGKILVGGLFTSYTGTAKNRVARLNTDGTLDATFTGVNVSGNIIGDAFTLALQPDGKILMGGGSNTYNNYNVRLNTNGSLDETFNPGTAANNPVFALALQPDEKVLIGGDFRAYDGIAANYITRLNTNGSLDATFNAGTGANNPVYGIALQLDGKILIGGVFTTYNGAPANRIGRLNTDGSLDATFTGTGANNAISTIAVQPDGKILVGGTFTTYNGTAINRLARLNADGSLDATFNPGTGASSTVLAFALQPDGKILMGGAFTSYNGTAANYITRLNADGSIDATFTGTGASSTVSSLALQANGNILVGGNFTVYDGVAKNYIARLNTDGSIDATFTGTGAGSQVTALALQTDGKILVGGAFTSYNGTTTNRLARLNTDGSLDPLFTGTGASNTVLALILQPDGKILTGGSFIAYSGIGRNRVARINSVAVILPLQLLAFSGSANSSTNLLQWQTATEINTRAFVVEKSIDGRNFTGIGTITAKGTGNGTYTYNDAFTLDGKVYYRLKIIDNDGRFNHSNIIKLTNKPVNQLILYPNPVNDKTTLQINDKTLVGSTAKIMDATGKTVQTFIINSNIATVNMMGLTTGLYLLQTANGSSLKIIKQ
jgi:uncharacterized delta-60 repeat protein